MLEVACKLLSRLALDVRLVKEADVRATIEDSLGGLFQAVPEEEWGDIVS
jgi:hypothetical protein